MKTCKDDAVRVVVVELRSEAVRKIYALFPRIF